MWTVILTTFLVLGLPDVTVADLTAFALRVAEALQQAGAKNVVLRSENPQMTAALEDSFRRHRLTLLKEADDTAFHVQAHIGQRRGRPLAAARIVSQGQEVAILFADLEPSIPAGFVPEEGPAIATRTRLLLTPDLPVLDVAADSHGDLFVLHPDRLRIYSRAASGLEMKAELGLDTGAERLRDPLVRMVVRESPVPQLEVHSAAPALAAALPLPVEGYEVKTFGAASVLRLPHPARAIFATLQPVEGRNYFRTTAVKEVQGIAPVLSPQRAYWIVLDGAGRLLAADADLRPLGSPISGAFGGDVVSVALSCAGTVVLAASAEANPSRDRLTLLRVENDRLIPRAHIELEGAVRRLIALPVAPERRGTAALVLAVTTRLEEIELSCAP